MVRTFMSYRARQELLTRVAPRYQEARGKEKSRILDEFVVTTGYARKYAIRLLHGPIHAPTPLQRTRAPRYGPAVQAALTISWSATNGICAKRLVPFLPELIPTLERHGHLHLSAEVRSALLTLSPATADRLLRAARQAPHPHGLGTTTPGRLLKQQIPVRTFAEWDDARPGFCEADLVAHCGGNTTGIFLYTLTLTDVTTGWTECLALPHRGQDAVVQALGHARRLLPFALLGLDTDNGSEFINAAVLAYCAETATTFTRGRVATSNDQCFVEQKNGSIVRQLVGYDRYVGEPAYRQLAELYRAVRLYVNFFQPSMKLRSKQREGSHVQRTYDAARTPFQRLLASGVLDAPTRTRLEAVRDALDPVRLLHQLQTLQDALWQHASVVPSASATTPVTREAVRFDAHACSIDEGSARATEDPEALSGAGPHRRYRRTPRRLGPRTYRTRPDPFAAVWDEVQQELAGDPERTAKAAFHALQQHYPGQFPDVQLRTLQRRVQAWRASVIIAFDDQWLRDEVLTDQVGPAPLRALAMSTAAASE
jgi:hypothetical protein